MGALVEGDSPPGMSVSTMERSLFALMGALEGGDSPPGVEGVFQGVRWCLMVD